MRLPIGGLVCALLLTCSTTASAQGPNDGGLPPLRRPVMEAGYLNENPAYGDLINTQPNTAASFWQDEAPPVPNPIDDLNLYDPSAVVPYVHPVSEMPYGYPQGRYLGHLGDGYYPYAPVAYNACCAYESACGDPTEYKLKVWTFCDIGHELWNEILFGVIDPTCRFDPDCSQGPPTCCRKHGIGLLDLFPEHKQRVLARRARACGCATTHDYYPGANPPPCNSCQQTIGYSAADRYAHRSTYETAPQITRIGGENDQVRTARQVQTIPTRLPVR